MSAAEVSWCLYPDLLAIDVKESSPAAGLEHVILGFPAQLYPQSYLSCSS